MQYSSITSSFATYSNLRSSYDTYYDLISGILSNSKYGEYELQIFKYQPLAYWRVNEYSSGSTEASIFNSTASLVKALNINIYKPIVNSLPSGTTAVDSTNGLSIAGGQLNLGSSTYTKQAFSINFWYKNLDNSFNDTLPIFSLGTNIKLYLKSGTFFLNFLGQKIYAPIDDQSDIYNIAITFNGSNANLIVNGKNGVSTFSIIQSFESSPAMTWLSNSTSYCIIQSISVFGYAMSDTQCAYLYKLGYISDRSENVFSSINKYSLEYSIPEYKRTLDYIPDSASIILKNCLFQDDTFYLTQKPLAINNGCTVATGGYQFSSTANIEVPITNNDFDISNCVIQLNSTLNTQSGTALYIDGSKKIKAVLSSGILNIYSSESSTAIYTSPSAIDSGSFKIIFSNKTIKIGVTIATVYTETDTKYSIPYYISSIKIGNNENDTDPFNGLVSKFFIDYADYSLPDGLYTLEMDNAANVNYISPRFGGVALLQILMKNGTTGNYINFKSSGGSRVQLFTSSNTIADYVSCQNGTTLTDNSKIITTSITQDTVAPVSVYLYSNGNSMSTDLDMPKLKELRVSAYNDKTIYVKEITASTTSAVTHPYNVLNNSLYVHDTFSISNTSYNIKDIFFKIKFKSAPTTGTLFSIGSTGITITASQTLQAISGATLTVNDGFPQQFKINEELYVRLSLTSSQPFNITFSKSNYYLSDLTFLDASGNYYDYLASRFFNYEFRNNIMYAVDASTISLTDSVIAKAFTSNIVFSG